MPDKYKLYTLTAYAKEKNITPQAVQDFIKRGKLKAVELQPQVEYEGKIYTFDKPRKFIIVETT